MKFAIIREGKTPSDARTPLTPAQCRQLQSSGIDIVVQSSGVRCYTDDEYRAANITVVDTVADRDILLGVKEVPMDELISDKTYFFFSHTIKKQPYNRPLLKEVLKKKIRLIDYEVLTNEYNQRVIAFGMYAGMVGAHNALWTWGMRTGDLALPRMKDCADYAAAQALYEKTTWPEVKIVLTGTGRVGQGAARVLDDMGIYKVSPEQFLENTYDRAVYTQLDCKDYVRRIDGRSFDRQDFYRYPDLYESQFLPYTAADIMINGIYWDNEAPAFFTKEEMKSTDFRIQVIADVTCDIAPVASIPATLRATTIADPVFGYDPHTEKETSKPFQPNSIDMMTIDNLPNEMPRDASQGFGEQFIANVLPSLISAGFGDPLLTRATIAEYGDLGSHFEYLRSWIEEEKS